MSPAVKGKILVVDDSSLATTLIERQLARRGHQVVTTTSGAEAIALFPHDNFALAILDVNMPDMDGFEVAEKIRGFHDELFLPILFLSADGQRNARLRGLRQGGAVYMTKPFNEEEFIAQVESLLLIKQLQDNLAQKNRLLEEMCRRDSLTSLYNHSYFQEMADHEFKRTLRYEQDLACVLLDLDNFKEINDSFGHPTGDRVLAELAELLLDKVRTVDVVARYGGEEFALLFPMTDLRHAKMVAERVRTAIADHVFDIGVRALRITASFGVATVLAHQAASSAEVIEFADKALYAAKHNGRNRTYVYVREGANDDAVQAGLDCDRTA
jgi:two-component system, cell cycle response regulator